MQYRQIFDDAIGKLKTEQRYRVFADIERDSSRFPHAIWHKPDGVAQDVTIWCSNDYLGMGVNPEVIAALQSAGARAHLELAEEVLARLERSGGGASA